MHNEIIMMIYFAGNERSTIWIFVCGYFSLSHLVRRMKRRKILYVVTKPCISFWVTSQVEQILDVTWGTTPFNFFAGLSTTNENAQPHTSPRLGQLQAQHSSLALRPPRLNRSWAVTLTTGCMRCSAVWHIVVFALYAEHPWPAKSTHVVFS